MYEQIADKITKFVLATLKKEKLLDMVANGSPRPGSKTLAKALSKYVEHDPVFASDIKNLRPHWFKKDISLSPLETVIQRMLDANSPAHKAHATRAFKNYCHKRAAEIGSTPERVAAGVKASVTKRRQKNTSTCSTR